MTTTAPTAAAGTAAAPAVPVRAGFWRRFRENRPASVALVVLGLLVVGSLAAPLIAPYAPEAIDVPRRLSLSTPQHWLGTDALGRDTFTRLLYAGRVSLFAAALAVAVATVIGVPLGLLAGYVGGRVDWLLGRAGDVLMTFPAIVLAIAIIAATGPGLQNAMIALGIVYAPRLFRVARASTLQVRAQTYVEASISIGTPAWRIVVRRVLPNIASPVLVQVSVMLAAALLAEAALSLLGLGVVPPTPSWGVMLGSGFREIRSTPLLVFWPGVAIAVATLSFNLIGDGLRDALGRRTRKAGS
ncbi:Dipeptide transport system permease protein DppC [Pseudonocardia sp. Ae168_Ps1]|uniref:ABC transporter permease n=1 Tax=unclassified Pseudonocardia TaxID=2619320 RepID=UPI0006CB2F46|nr:MULTISPECIES: ABC transporter permease [unclassified Pseudonocardia]ALE73439.1 peptide ABC transporter permease [Pseudonocardia sp. EC080625-04]ALL77042.1 peptide ABC transporter permease [Pseudonocardia sp. EC080610-09]ALL84073.1 peptide ABC transporter permease [Pseudonocardia sp. EC080619-01]OLL71901.1 Dipeptide transport system permease protein DppC [Pseudonocardia sp. Ae150A_Ps1]OLL77869.1 Dipeptide transport system permease protein DppC [Pseudonocardia sp. Ae168_Ps1]